MCCASDSWLSLWKVVIRTDITINKLTTHICLLQRTEMKFINQSEQKSIVALSGGRPTMNACDTATNDNRSVSFDLKQPTSLSFVCFLSHLHNKYVHLSRSLQNATLDITVGQFVGRSIAIAIGGNSKLKKSNCRTRFFRSTETLFYFISFPNNESNL